MSRFTWAPGWSGWITARSRAMRPTRLWRARFRQSVRTWRANAGFRPGIPCWTAWQYWGATPTTTAYWRWRGWAFCRYFCWPAPWCFCGQIGVLAEQPGAGADQGRRAVPDGFLRLRVDALRRGRRVELDPPIRSHVPAGVLGAHRTGIRPRFVVAEGQPDRPRDRVCRRGGDPADAGDLHSEDPPRKVAGHALQLRLELHAPARFVRGGLSPRPRSKGVPHRTTPTGTRALQMR